MRLLSLKSILVAVDPEGASPAALRAAARLAPLAGARLHLLRVVEPWERGGDGRLREEFRRVAPDAPEPDTAHAIPGGEVAVTILEHARRIEADAIVLGPHGRGDQGGDMGSTAASVVRDAPCPCLVAATDLRLPLARVTVPIDLAMDASPGLAVAISWASALRPPGGTARVTALHVSANPTASTAEPAVLAEVERARGDAGSAAHVEIDARVIAGDDPASAILGDATSRGTDLLVMGTSGTARAPLIGSVSAGVIRRTSCPLLLVPPHY